MGMFKGNSAHTFFKKLWFTSLLSPESYAYFNYFIPVDPSTTFYFFPTLRQTSLVDVSIKVDGM
jgi:hypothetical protein